MEKENVKIILFPFFFDFFNKILHNIAKKLVKNVKMWYSIKRRKYLKICIKQ